jgi:hypothetical protein
VPALRDEGPFAPGVPAPAAAAAPSGDRVALEAPVYEPAPAKWAIGHAVRPFEFTLRLAFFAVAPCVFTVIALAVELWQLLAIMVVSLLVFGFLSGVDAILHRYPLAARTPVVGNALEYLSRMTAFYRVNKPFHFLYYLLYPLAAPLAVIWSRVARQEVGVFAHLLGAVILLVLAPLGLNYFSVYPPHLGIPEALLNLLLYAVLTSILVVVFFIPTATTALTLHAAGANRQLRVLVCIGLFSGLPMGLVYSFVLQPPVSYTSARLLEERLRRASFHEELTASATMFLDYWGRRVDNWDKSPTADITVHDDLTEKLQRHVGGIVVGNEARAFRVLTWHDANETPWLALGVWTGSAAGPPQLLFISRAGGTIYARWGEVPVDARSRFERVSRRVTERYAVVSERLLGDLRRK